MTWLGARTPPVFFSSSVRATLASSDISVPPDQRALRIVLLNPDGVAAYIATVDAGELVDLRGCGTLFKFRDETGTLASGLTMAGVRVSHNRGIAKIRAKSKGTELSEAQGHSHLTLSLLFGADPSSGDCLTTLQASCRGNEKRMRCRLP